MVRAPNRCSRFSTCVESLRNWSASPRRSHRHSVCGALGARSTLDHSTDSGGGYRVYGYWPRHLGHLARTRASKCVRRWSSLRGHSAGTHNRIDAIESFRQLQGLRFCVYDCSRIRWARGRFHLGNLAPSVGPIDFSCWVRCPRRIRNRRDGMFLPRVRRTRRTLGDAGRGLRDFPGVAAVISGQVKPSCSAVSCATTILGNRPNVQPITR